MDAGRYHRSIQLGDAIDRLAILAGDYFDDFRERMLAIAGINALGRITQFEIAPLRQPGMLR